MPTTTNLVLPIPAVGDNPSATVLASLAQAMDAFAGPWVSYPLTVTQSASVARTILYAKYRQVGKQVYFAFGVKLNANGTAANPVLIPLPPVAPKFTTVDMSRGIIDFVSRNIQAMLISPSGNTTQVRIRAGSGDYTTQLANLDVLRGWGNYEVA